MNIKGLFAPFQIHRSPVEAQHRAQQPGLLRPRRDPPGCAAPDAKREDARQHRGREMDLAPELHRRLHRAKQDPGEFNLFLSVSSLGCYHHPASLIWH